MNFLVGEDEVNEAITQRKHVKVAGKSSSVVYQCEPEIEQQIQPENKCKN